MAPPNHRVDQSFCGGDYAESVDVSGERSQYEPGDVLVIDPGTRKTFSRVPNRILRRLLVSISTRPGVVGNRSGNQEKLKDQVPMAMVGISDAK